MPKHDAKYYEKADAYRAERLPSEDPLTCPLQIGDSVDFVHHSYSNAYFDAIVVGIELVGDATHYEVEYRQHGDPPIARQIWRRGGLFKSLSAIEVLGEEYFS